jgi:hypothetical protein
MTEHHLGLPDTHAQARIGYPTDPSRVLDRLEPFYKAGHIYALRKALWLCSELHARAPDWVVAGALTVVDQRLEEPLVTGRGRTGNEGAKSAKDRELFEQYVLFMLYRSQGMKPGGAKEAVIARLTKLGRGKSGKTVERAISLVKKSLADPAGRFRFFPYDFTELNGPPGYTSEIPGVD